MENNLAKIENPEEKEKIQKSIQFVDYLIERKIRAEKNLKEKSIDDLTLEEAKDALSNLQNEYANLEDSYK
ncbi:MAG: hypothetical protein LBF15_03225 [Candidatus Peribacteria bacterium]|nr:hypothetical protein [Candidatus Peribacteria bacterium]